MTRPVIDDAMVERLRQHIADEWGLKFGVGNSIRAALEAALDRRTGEKDRRKVRDDLVAVKNALRLGGYYGRQSTNKTSWTSLPLAKPPIHVSEGMKEAGKAAFESWWHDRAKTSSFSCSVAVYTAMESKRREEAGE